MHLLFFIGALIFFQSCSSSKNTTGLTETEVNGLLQEQAYEFKATNMQPTGMSSRLITDTYTFLVTKEKLVSDLPYVGRAFTVNIGGTDGGMKFQSTDFTYTAEDAKNKRKEIIMKPKDISDIQEIALTVYNNGTANLRINSNSRQSISYNGDIRAIRKTTGKSQ